MVQNWLHQITQGQLAQVWKKIRLRLNQSNFWRNAGLLMLANVIVTALGLVRTPAMTWIIPKEEIGMLGVVAAWLPFVQLLSMSGGDVAAYHYVAKGQPWAFISNLGLRFRWSLFSTAVYLAGASYWAWRGQSGLGWMFAIAGLSYPFTYGMTAGAGILGAQQRFRGLFWYRIWESLTDFAGFIPLALSAFWISRMVTFFTANQFATSLMQTAVSLWLAWQIKRSGAAPLQKAEKRELMRYGQHQTALAAVGTVQTRVDALLVGSFLSLNTMADYAIALLIYEQCKRLWNIYGAVRYPVLVLLPLPRRRQRMWSEGMMVWLVFGLGIMALNMLAHWLIPIVLPPVYATSIPYIGWLLASFTVGLPGYMAEMYFRTSQDQHSQYIMRIPAAVTGVLFPAALLIPWGVQGVLAGRFLASLLLSVIALALVIRQPSNERKIE